MWARSFAFGYCNYKKKNRNVWVIFINPLLTRRKLRGRPKFSYSINVLVELTANINFHAVHADVCAYTFGTTVSIFSWQRCVQQDTWHFHSVLSVFPIAVARLVIFKFKSVLKLFVQLHPIHIKPLWDQAASWWTACVQYGSGLLSLYSTALGMFSFLGKT